VAPRNLLIALLAAVLVIVVIASAGRRASSVADDELRVEPQASGSIAPSPGASLDAGEGTDGSAIVPDGSPGPAGASGESPLPPDYGDPSATDLHPTSTSPERPDPAGSSSDPYPTSVGPEDLAPGDATPAADPLPTSLPEGQADWPDAATLPGEASASPTSTDSAAGPPDPRTPSDATQRPKDAHPTGEQVSPTG
jgi:hypothetical protein